MVLPKWRFVRTYRTSLLVTPIIIIICEDDDGDDDDEDDDFTLKDTDHSLKTTQKDVQREVKGSSDVSADMPLIAIGLRSCSIGFL
jgi:hypothetical protein